VYTHADQPGENLWFPSVTQLAQAHGLPVRITDNLRSQEELEIFRALAPDLVFSFYFRSLIPNPMLALPALGAFNMHGSLLPRYRGRAPVNWAVLNGETETGATLHEMVEKADAGDIVDQEAVPIGPDDTAAHVQQRVTSAAVTVLARQMDNLRNHRAPRRPQDHAHATTFGKRTPADGEIDWKWPPERIHNLVRAVSHPYPGAFGPLFGEKTWIWKTRLPVPGQSSGLLVPCGGGRRLEILRLQRPGEPEISGEEFLQSHMASERRAS
jgi:methionyl-tRNA formyltransferase